MNKSIDALSREIDELLLYKLELIEEKIRGNIQMEILLKDGYIELAKAKYIRGKENIGILQVPSNTDVMVSLFNLETTEISENDNTVPSTFDISLKTSNNEVDCPSDPIRWFGVLVPQNLKTSQKRFQESVYLAIKIANIQVQLVSVFSKLKTLYIQKSNLHCQDNIAT